jgi:hypothetical protein
MPKVWCDGDLGVVSHNVDQECYWRTPLNLILIQEKAVRLYSYEAVKEEIAI